jgi:hypothetical protein
MLGTRVTPKNPATTTGWETCCPYCAHIRSNHVLELGLQVKVVLLQICVEIISPQHPRNLNQLVLVVVTVEERVFLEDLRQMYLNVGM